MSIFPESRNMERQTVVIIECDDHIECYGSLKAACDVHTEFVFNTVRRKQFPFEYMGWKFYKVRFNQRTFYAKRNIR